jgi:hypothetical protein
MKRKTIMSLAAVLPLAWNPTAGATDSPDAAAIKNPSTVVEHRGVLRIFTPDRKRWQPYFEYYVWGYPSYGVYRQDGTKVRTGYDRQPLTLDAGVYQVKLEGSSAPPTRVVVKPGRITEITMPD